MTKYATGIKSQSETIYKEGTLSTYIFMFKAFGYQAGCVNMGRAWLDKSTREVFLRDISTAAINWWEAQGTCTESGSLSLTGLRGLV